MPDHATDITRRLAQHAEAVCRYYLSNGRREGRHWLVGDADNTPGRSLFVRLASVDPAKPAGKWTDAATGEHCDLLDIIARRERLTFRDTLDEARRFLALPRAGPLDPARPRYPTVRGSPEAARRLFAMAKPIGGTLAGTYLRGRGILGAEKCTALRSHPRCWYRSDSEDSADHALDNWPTLIAAVTDHNGVITGVHRTWLDPAGNGKAPISTPRRAMGQLLGNGVRFGRAVDVLVAGEGIETLLSLRSVMPTMPMIAALSAGHLGALTLPRGLRRLYIAQDNDPAGHHAAEALAGRAREAGIKPSLLIPALGDFNDDLCELGFGGLADGITAQLEREDMRLAIVHGTSRAA
jgi:hypothetical protein